MRAIKVQSAGAVNRTCGSAFNAMDTILEGVSAQGRFAVRAVGFAAANSYNCTTGGMSVHFPNPRHKKSSVFCLYMVRPTLKICTDKSLVILEVGVS